MSPITPKNWVDAPPGWEIGDAVPGGATPLNAVALEDLETRMGAYTDTVNTAMDTRVDALEAAPDVFIQATQPTGLTAPALWIPTVAGAPVPITQWEVYIP